MTTPASSLVELRPTRSLRELYSELGRALLAHQRAADAVQALKQALNEAAESPPNWELHYVLGMALQQTEDAPAAFRAYLEAATEAPQHSGEMIDRARSLLNERTVAANADWLFDGWAETILEHASLTNEPKADAALFLGLSRLYLGESDKAEVSFEQALSLRPGEPSMMMEIGEAFRRTGNLRQASEFLTAASALAGKKSSPQEVVLIKTRYIELLVDQQEYSAALERTLEIQTEDPSVRDELLLARARSCLGLGRFEDALKALDEITQKKAQSDKFEFVRAHSLLGLHRYDEVITTLRQTQRDSTSAEVTLLTIQALIEGIIDLAQGERLLVNLRERIGLGPIQEWLRSPVIAARTEDSRVHFFVSYISRMLAPDIPLDQALQEVDRALSLRTSADGDNFEAAAWQLKGEILDVLKKTEDAAMAHYEAGRRWYWARNPQAAEEQLLLAAKLNENHPSTWWNLAEVRCSQSYTNVPPYVDEATIKTALKDWETGFAKLAGALPGADDSWCYVVRTLIAEKLSSLPDEDTGEKLSEAATYLERAILHKSDDFYRWATLAREHRSLENEVNALRAVEQAEKFNATQPLVLEEKAAISCDTGANDVALATLATLNETTPHPVYDGWKAFVLVHERRYGEALELIQKSVAGDPEGLWARSWLADIQALTLKLPEAAKEYEWIRSQRQNPNYKDSEFSFARAAVMLGIINRTLDLLDQASAEITRVFTIRSEAVSARLMLTLCRMAQNRLEEASHHFVYEYLPQIANQHYVQWTEIMIGWITDLAREQGWPHSDHLQALVNGPQGFSARIAARHEEILSRQRSPIDELNLALADEEKAQKGSWRWVAFRSGLARLHREEKHWDEARRTYESLLPESGKFPEAQLALTRLAESIAAEGRELLKGGQFAEAQELFEKYRSKVAAGEPKKMAEAYVLMGLAAAGMGNLSRGRGELSDALAFFQVAGTQNAGAELGRIASEHLSSASHYWAVDGLLNEMRDDTPAEVINQAHVALQPWLGNAYRLAEDSSLISVVTPIALEIGNDLAPPNENPDDWIFLQEYVPRMREQIKEEMGLPIPGLRVRHNEGDMPVDSYIIMLDEVPRVMGRVQMGKCFCVASMEELKNLGIPEESLSAASHPGTGAQGCWVHADYQSLISSKGLELWNDAYLYVIHHIKTLLEQNLTMFLGVQEVANLIEEWKKTEGGGKLVTDVVPDLTAGVRLGRVLRELLSEGVTIAPWREILEAVREVGLLKDDVADVVRIVRLRLKKFLPGNTEQTVHINLPQEVEDRLLKCVQEQNGKRFLAIMPNDTMEVLNEIRAIVPNDRPRVTLVLSDAKLRPMVRQLVALEFPRLIVQAREELS